MGKAKMFKINSVATFPNVFQNPHYTNPKLINSEGEEIDLRGKWRADVFKNEQPFILELACGHGDYTISLAEKFPDKNFMGVDVKGARIFTGSKKALERNLKNVAFARMRIENITNFFAEGEIDEIWITFPDPFPRKDGAKRRLTAPAFLKRYAYICKPGAIVNFKTDDLPLFHFTRDMVNEAGLKMLYYKEDIYSGPLDFEELGIQTHYEKSHLANGRKINYLKFQLK
jgi:tRNA (guanine-N7-)-methyltransferase